MDALQRIGPPLCRVQSEQHCGSSMVQFLSPTSYFSANERKVYFTTPKETRLVRQERAVVSHLIQSGVLVWSLAASGTFATFSDDGTLVAEGSLERLVVCSAKHRSSGILVGLIEKGTTEVVSIIPEPAPPESTHAFVGVRLERLFRIEGKVLLLPTIGQLVFSISQQGNIDVWDYAESTDVTPRFGNPQLDLGSCGAPTCDSVVSEEELWIGTSSGTIVTALFEGAKGASWTYLTQHAAAVTSLTIMGDGDCIWSTSMDGGIVVWDISQKLAIGSFHSGPAGIVSLQPVSHTLTSLMHVMDTSGRASLWQVDEAIQFFKANAKINATSSNTREIADASATDQYVRFISQLSLLLGREVAPETVAVPDCVTRSVPESRFLLDAVASISECSSQLGAALEELGLEPSHLEQDLETVIQIAIRATRLERTLMQTLGERSTATRSSAAALTHLRESVLRRPAADQESLQRCSALRNDLQRAMSEISAKDVEIAHLRAELDGITRQQAVEREDAKRRSDDAEASMHKLRREVDLLKERLQAATAAPSDELQAKNQLIEELLQMVKANTNTIDELRARNKSRKAELAAATEASAAATRELETLRSHIQRTASRLEEEVAISGVDASRRLRALC